MAYHLRGWRVSLTGILLGHDAVVAAWVAQKLGCDFCPPFVGIGRISQGRLVAGAVYASYTPSNVELTLYAPDGAAKRRFWGYVVYDYPFRELGVLRITMRTRRSNTVTRRLLERLGTFEGVQKRFFGPTKHDDAFVFGVFPDKVRKYSYGRK